MVLEGWKHFHDRIVGKASPWSGLSIGPAKYAKKLAGLFGSAELKLGGPAFPAIYSSNIRELVRQKPRLMAGICLYSTGVIRATQKIGGREYSLDISQDIPVEIDPGSKSSYEEWRKQGKFHAKLPRFKFKGRWKLSEKSKYGIPLGKVAKIFRYFEIAKAMKSPITFVIPTEEYFILANDNAKKLGIKSLFVKRAVRAFGEEYREAIKKIGRRFFQDVKIDIISTHENQANSAIKMKADSDKFVSAYRQSTSSYMGSAFSITPAMDLFERRSISQFADASKPTIWLLSGRDLASVFPFSLKIAERMGVDLKKIGVIGLPGGPAINEWGWAEQEKDYLEYTNKFAELDDYLGRYPGQTANLKGTLRITRPLMDDEGMPRYREFLHTLGPYVGIIPKKGREREQFFDLHRKLRAELGVTKIHRYEP